MSIRQVPMYRVECDYQEGCAASPQDDTDYFAWANEDAAVDDAVNHGSWYIGVRGHLCEDHAPRCLRNGCDLRLWDDEFGVVCEDHADNGEPVVTDNEAAV